MKRLSLHFTYACLLVAAVALTSVWQPLRQLNALAQGNGNCQTFKETGQTVCGKFLAYWNSHGGLAQQGYPIGPELQEISELNGQPYTVQYFERAVFELHPENQPPNDVLLSQLGTYQARRRYGNPPVWLGAPALVPMPLRNGVTVTLIPKSNAVGRATGVDSCRGGGMNWVLQIENGSNTPYTAVLDRGYFMADSTGKEYRDDKTNCATALVGPVTEGPYTVQAAQSSDFLLYLDSTGLPATATYLDLHISVSGTPVTFRYMLR